MPPYTLPPPNPPTTTPKPSINITIIGAGLVGLTTAILLAKSQTHFRITTLEQDAELHELGAGIQLPPNATRVLRSLGGQVFEKIVERAVEPEGIVLHSYRNTDGNENERKIGDGDDEENGAVLSHMHLTPSVRERYGVPMLVIQRAELRRVLFEEAIRVGVEVRMGVRVDAKTIDEEHGADLVIAADGAGSAFSRHGVLLHDGEYTRRREMHSTGKVVQRVVISAEAVRQTPGLEDFVGAPPKIHTWLGPGSLAVCYLLKKSFNIVVTRPADGEMFSGARRVGGEEVRKYFAGWDGKLRKLLQLGQEFQEWNLMEYREPLSKWVSEDGRVALVGDAAQALLPYLAQGAAMGFESAAVLAGLLSKARRPEEIPGLLGLYDEQRRLRAAHVAEASRKTGEMWMLPDGDAQVGRDRIFREERPPSEGFSNMLEDPGFQKWLWGFNAARSVEESMRHNQ